MPFDRRFELVSIEQFKKESPSRKEGIKYDAEVKARKTLGTYVNRVITQLNNAAAPGQERL